MWENGFTWSLRECGWIWSSGSKCEWNLSTTVNGTFNKYSGKIEKNDKKINKNRRKSTKMTKNRRKWQKIEENGKKKRQTNRRKWDKFELNLKKKENLRKKITYDKSNGYIIWKSDAIANFDQISIFDQWSHFLSQRSCYTKPGTTSCEPKLRTMFWLLRKVKINVLWIFLVIMNAALFLREWEITYLIQLNF